MGLFFTDILGFLKRRRPGFGLEQRIRHLDIERLSEHQLRDLNLRMRDRKEGIAIAMEKLENGAEHET